MARMARVVVPGIPHHVTQRGNRRQQIFFDEEDYATYLSLMAASCRCVDTRIWAYCLMPNHVHFILVPSAEDGLRGALSDVHRRYARLINARNGWRGHLWQERFYSCPMDDVHLHGAVRYVERNPVAAGLCRSPTDWPWSSARAHIAGRDDALVEVAPMLDRIDDWRTYLANVSDALMVDKIARHTRTGRPLGTKVFIAELEQATGRMLAPRSAGRKRAPP